ncbi:MAG: FkbM family methyltransferase [Bryobacteraceae bacterium]
MTAKNITDAHVALQLFAGYTEADTAIFDEFMNPDAKPQQGFLVDFLGSRIRTTSLWKQARALDGRITGIPVPADFHTEAIEWIGLLKAARSAKDQYVAMELGAGFGPWSVAGATAARRRGIRDIRLCAVEADPQHFQFLQQHFADNGFDPGRHALFEAAVGVSTGVAQWPLVEDSSEAWGCRPLEDGRDYTGREFNKTKQVSVISMLDLVRREPRWDLVHIDVQGDEVDICRSCIDELNARVRWIIVGTHSRKIDGDLMELLWRSSWWLEHEKPARFLFAGNRATLEAMTTIDGTQVWRNPRLMHEGDALTSFSQEIGSSFSQFRMKAGETYAVDISVKNTGTQVWYGRAQVAPVNASYRWLDNTDNVLPIEGNRAFLTRAVVRPGESDALKLDVTAPPDPGSYKLWISMVQEAVSWFYDRGAKPLVLQVTVD